MQTIHRVFFFHNFCANRTLVPCAFEPKNAEDINIYNDGDFMIQNWEYCKKDNEEDDERD